MRKKNCFKRAFPFFTGLFTLLFCAALFISPLADHNCTYDDCCPGCLQLQEAKQLQKQMESVFVRSAEGAVFSGAPLVFVHFFPSGPAFSSSITLKVRMNT
jgi:hypothetical protein